VPFLPVLSMVSCLVLMLSLPLETWIRFVVWLILGLGIYFLYGRKQAAAA
jgi:APA family basic amino acid/polyamine antiporter